MLDDIIRLISPLYSNKKIVCFVDVFGGAGNVLLNIPLEWRINRVYNDIDLRLYNLLNDLKDDKKRDALFEKLFWTLASRKLFNDFKEKENNNSFEFLYRLFYSFNAGLNGYKIEINTIRNTRSQLNNLKKNWYYIKDWYIEHLDFKELIKKYDGKNTFFYLDPPYLTGGKNYKHSFTEADFKELKNSLDDIQGYYMMNESEVDFDKIIKIFGEPKLIKKYVNYVNTTNIKQTKSKNRNIYRQEGYWTNY